MIKYISIMCVMLLLLSSCDHKDEIIEVDNNTMTWEIDYTNINTNKIEDLENTLWNWIEGIDKDFDKNISNANYQLDNDLKILYLTYEQDKILIESSSNPVARITSTNFLFISLATTLLILKLHAITPPKALIGSQS